MAMLRNEISALLRELGSEDDWGSWELWWNISANIPESEIKQAKKTFLEVMEELINSGEILPKRKNENGQLAPAVYDRTRLSQEIDLADNPNPDTFFWFGAT